MNKERAEDLRDAINESPSVIEPDENAANIGYKAPRVCQTGVFDDGSGKEPVFVVILEPHADREASAQSLGSEVVYEAAKFDCGIRFYPSEHHTGPAVWFVDHFWKQRSDKHTEISKVKHA